MIRIAALNLVRTETGAKGRIRTDTGQSPSVFETDASANSTTKAHKLYADIAFRRVISTDAFAYTLRFTLNDSLALSG
jgi:hypothetical protein